ncbi:Uncharacterised protein [Klebsiella pneumoniae]|nr:Uncharacterised protein [Klebsiella pneumoniae]
MGNVPLECVDQLFSVVPGHRGGEIADVKRHRIDGRHHRGPCTVSGFNTTGGAQTVGEKGGMRIANHRHYRDPIREGG